MAKKISQFTYLDNLVGTELIPVVHNGANYIITFEDIKKSIDKGDLGLDQVDNTSDLDKPVSIAVSEELGRKANVLHSHNPEDITNLDDHIETKIIETVGDKADRVHLHQISDVDGLTDVLAGKAEEVHSHEMTQISGLSSAIANKAEAIHSHQMSEVVGLGQELTRIETDLGDRIDDKTEIGHTHEIENINGLSSILDEIDNVLSTVVTHDNVHQSVATTINNANLINASQLNTAVNSLTLAIGEKADRIHNHISEHITDLQPVVEDIVSDLGLGMGDITVGNLDW